MKFSAKVHPWFREQDGWWYVTRRVNGKRVQQKLAQGRDSEEAAFKRFHEIMASSGAVEVRPEVTFNEIAYLFLAWCRQNKDAGTADWYLHFISSFDETYSGTIQDMKKSHVEAWLDGKSWGQSTRRQAITCIKRVINWAYEEGQIPAVPEGLRKLRRPKMKTRERLLTSDEHELMLKHSDEHFGRFLTALRETGARPGEVRTVTAAHVDLKLGIWRFEQHKTADATQRDRLIFLTPAMLELTKKLMEQHPTGPLFRNKQGKPWTSNAVRCRMRRLREKLNLPEGTVAYCYRHTFATDGLQRGVPIAEMAELLGHSDTRMVSEHYGHLRLRTEHMREAARRAASSE